MNTTDIFEEASRLKIRFQHRGIISTEDLWDLNLEQLDGLYKVLMKEAKQSDEDGLITPAKEDHELDIKIELVKHVFTVKKAEAEKRENDALNAAKKQRILEVLAKKREDALQGMSEDELLAMLNDLG